MPALRPSWLKPPKHFSAAPSFALMETTPMLKVSCPYLCLQLGPARKLP